MHHRQRRAGGIHTAANLMHLCGSGTTGCHGWITAHPALSRAAGWIVSAYSDPSVEPVRYRCKFWAWLTEDGRIVGEGAAA
jgi:Asp/Glu/hydantoin racemase